MMRCWKKQSSIWLATHDGDNPTPVRASFEVIRQWRIAERFARGLDGATASFDARRVPNGRRVGRRKGRQAQAHFWLPAPQPRKNRRRHHLPGFNSLHRSARLLLFAHQQLGLLSGGGKAGWFASA